jgi:hypothetical protein
VNLREPKPQQPELQLKGAGRAFFFVRAFFASSFSSYALDQALKPVL